ncbi:MAG: hypothetical protein JKX98_03760 [Alcanivoracaceae bacterium]|nr:hypothetical protein [Alcanivoracaceae bacterium]
MKQKIIIIITLISLFSYNAFSAESDGGNSSAEPQYKVQCVVDAATNQKSCVVVRTRTVIGQ